MSVVPELPLHVQLMLTIVVGSGLTCLAVVLPGMFRWVRGSRDGALSELPPLPSTFPCGKDQIMAAAYTLFLLWTAASGLMAYDGSPQSLGSITWGSLCLGLFSHLAIYLPVLLRYGYTHPWHHPTRPWWHYLTMPILVWACICASVILLEKSGLTPWIVRMTECPEYQNLVIVFSRGDTMQRLYITISAVIIAPLAEECCFRGFLYTTLRRWGGCVPAAIASALVFGSIHGSLAQMLPLTIFGIAQCIAYEKAQSLWLPIGTHMFFNTASLIATAVMLP